MDEPQEKLIVASIGFFGSESAEVPLGLKVIELAV